MIFQHPKKLREHTSRLHQFGVPYKLTQTSGTSKLEFHGRRIMFSNSARIPLKYLYLFKQVKNEILKNTENLEIPKYCVSDSNYFKFAPVIFDQMAGSFKGDILELDINKAYYTAALNLGYLSREFYEKCLDLPKQVRLVLIGSIATRRQITEFKNGQKYIHHESNSKLRGIWFNIVNYVDNCLNDFAKLQAPNFLFYWVDGIYVINNPQLKSDLKIISEKYNFEFSNQKIEEMQILNFGEFRKVILYKNGDKKEFTTTRKVNFNPNEIC